MRRLESDGLLVKQARKMATVRELTEADMMGLYLLREGLEAISTRLCSQHITGEQVVSLQELSETYERVWEKKHQKSDADFAIPRHIAQCAGCPLLSDELDRLMLIERTAGRTLSNAIANSGHARSHRALVQAIVDRDTYSAEYLMKKHIQNGYHEAMREFAGEK